MREPHDRFSRAFHHVQENGKGLFALLSGTAAFMGRVHGGRSFDSRHVQR